MEPRDVSPYEMSALLNMNDGEFEALCAGQVPSDDERLGDLAGFLNDFAEAHPEPSTKPYEAVHLAAMVEAAHLMAEMGDPAAMPASKADGPAVQASGLPMPGRKKMLSKLMGAPLYAKLASALAAFMLVFTGVAYAGALPGPVQDAVADGANAVGIDLPGGADEALGQNDDDIDPNLADEDLRVDPEDEDDDSPAYVDPEDEDDDSPAYVDPEDEDDDSPAYVDPEDEDDDSPAYVDPDDEEDDDSPAYVDPDDEEYDDSPAYVDPDDEEYDD